MTPLQMFIPYALDFLSELAEVSGAQGVTLKELRENGFIYCWLVNKQNIRITPIIGISEDALAKTSLN